MNEKSQSSDNRECQNPGHAMHLCHLQYEGYHYSHRPEYKALVQEAEHICRNCGRTAKSATSLCDPVPL